MIFEEVPRTEDHASWTSLSTAARPTPGALPSSLPSNSLIESQRTPFPWRSQVLFCHWAFAPTVPLPGCSPNPSCYLFLGSGSPLWLQPSQLLGHVPCRSLSQTPFLFQHFPECMTLPILSVLATSPSRAGLVPHVQHLAWASDGTQLTLTGPLDWMNGRGAPAFLLLKKRVSQASNSCLCGRCINCDVSVDTCQLAKEEACGLTTVPGVPSHLHTLSPSPDAPTIYQCVL